MSHTTTTTSFKFHFSAVKESQFSSAVPVLEQGFRFRKQFLAHYRFGLHPVENGLSFLQPPQVTLDAIFALVTIFAFKYLIPCILALTRITTIHTIIQFVKIT